MSAAGGKAKTISGKTETLKELIRVGMDVNAKDQDGFTALMSTTAFNIPEKIKSTIVLIEQGKDVTLVGDNSIDSVKLLISADANVNAKTKDGWTALMFAVLWKTPNTVKELLASGADVNAKTEKGMTPLKIATSKGFIEIAEFLKQAGAKE